MNTTLTMSIKDAAAQLGLTHWTLRKLVRQGEIHAVRIGRRVLIQPAELDRLIERSQTGGNDGLSN